MSDLAADLRNIVAVATPVLRRWHDLTIQCNQLFLRAWEEGVLDELWKSLDHPGLYLHYFIRARGIGDIKFGKTNNIQQRFESIFSGCSRGADLIACYPDLPEHETEIKFELMDSRLSGEWVAPTKEVLDFLRSIGSNVDSFTDEPAPSFMRGGPIRLRRPRSIRKKPSSPREPSGNSGQLASAPEKPANAIESTAVTESRPEPKAPTDARRAVSGDLAIPDDLSIPKAFRRAQPWEAAS